MQALRIAAALLGLAAPAAAQTTAPATLDGTVVRHTVSDSLAREFAALSRDTSRASWIGYAVSARHGHESVVDRLIAMARDGRDRQARSSALFWLSQRAGERAAGTIADAVDRDPDAQVKRQAVFALSQLPRDEGVPRLIDVARSNRSTDVRKQAMFWLGQSQDPRALAFLRRGAAGALTDE